MKALDVISWVAMPQQIAEIARPIALRHHVNELYLFGSMARGEGHADSDIDFIYQFADTANPMIDEWALRDDLASTFGREIDLVKKRYITTELQDRLAEMQLKKEEEAGFMIRFLPLFYTKNEVSCKISFCIIIHSDTLRCSVR